jgi:lipoprotein LprG
MIDRILRLGVSMRGMMGGRLFAVVAGIVAVVVVGGCSAGPSAGPTLPDGVAVTEGAAAAMRTVTSAHVVIVTTGTIGVVRVRRAEFDLTASGSAKGTARAQLLDGPINDYEFVMVGSSVWLKGPSGTWSPYSARTNPHAAVYDPSSILDSTDGIAGVLAGSSHERTEASETIDGRSYYRVETYATDTALTGLMPGLSGSVFRVDFWADPDSKRVRRLVVYAPPAGPETGTVTFDLTAVNEPVTVTPPAT